MTTTGADGCCGMVSPEGVIGVKNIGARRRCTLIRSLQDGGPVVDTACGIAAIRAHCRAKGCRRSADARASRRSGGVRKIVC
ncbi:hypothetical protein C7S15_2690 [Burkholderia cepacia]|nr:hypothetical protein [Burkholderia cepacia]